MTVAGVNGNMPLICSRDVCISPDEGLSDAAGKGPYDAVVLPGGGGGSKAFCAVRNYVFSYQNDLYFKNIYHS